MVIVNHIMVSVNSILHCLNKLHTISISWSFACNNCVTGRVRSKMCLVITRKTINWKGEIIAKCEPQNVCRMTIHCMASNSTSSIITLTSTIFNVQTAARYAPARLELTFCAGSFLFKPPACLLSNTIGTKWLGWNTLPDSTIPWKQYKTCTSTTGFVGGQGSTLQVRSNLNLSSPTVRIIRKNVCVCIRS